MVSGRCVIPVQSLGQAGVRLEFPKSTIYVDPYLSDGVEELEGVHMRRQFPKPMSAGEIGDADWVLVTHIHLDHCDLNSLLPIAHSSPSCRFLCPNECAKTLAGAGIHPSRVRVAGEKWFRLSDDVNVVAVPAAHPQIERDGDGHLRYVGYVIESDGRRIYHAGDTSPADEMISRLEALSPIDAAFLPVNERNFYRERRGIVGNMTIREAFQLAQDLAIHTVVPVHWDMFAPNSVYREEIQLLYDLMRPSFSLKFYPKEL